MLIVLGVITLLAGIALALTLRVENQSKENALANVFTLLKSALEEYYDFKGEFPAGMGGQTLYAALDSVPASHEVLKRIDSVWLYPPGRQPGPSLPRIYDPWGTPLSYRYVPSVDSFPEIVSAGPDKQFGTADDISTKDK